MMQPELIKSKEELEKIASSMSEEISNFDEPVVSRFCQITYDTVMFSNGKKSTFNYNNGCFNKEMMQSGIYSTMPVNDLDNNNIDDIKVARDLQTHRFSFAPKNIQLPKLEEVIFESIPSTVDKYDQFLKEFSRLHLSTRVSRSLQIEQKIVTNSEGGLTIQSIPFFSIHYNHGYQPIPTNRAISAVCNSNKDIKDFTKLIKYIADPTPENRIKNSRTFFDAFHELHLISGLKYGSLEEAGIPLSGLYNAVMLTGVPVHEIFGHHFEEPIRHLDYGESGTFQQGQNIGNKDLVLKDDPQKRIEGFRAHGSTHFDAYGRKREERTHIQDGKVKEYLGSEYADPKNLKSYMNIENSPFVGNTTQSEDGFFPQPRMSCTVLDGKTEDIDLEGKLLLVPHQGHTSPNDKTYMVKSYESYVLEDGIPKRVIPVNVTGGINQALSNITLLDEESYQIGNCGKPEPIYYPNARGTASAPVSQFAKSQLWEDQQVYPLQISDNHLRILQKGIE